MLGRPAALYMLSITDRVTRGERLFGDSTQSDHFHLQTQQQAL